MSKTHDLKKLRSEHAQIEAAIAQAYARARPDLDGIAALKKRKLALKDEIARMEAPADSP